jgi:hypothetical protein
LAAVKLDAFGLIVHTDRLARAPDADQAHIIERRCPLAPLHREREHAPVAVELKGFNAKEAEFGRSSPSIAEGPMRNDSEGGPDPA